MIRINLLPEARKKAFALPAPFIYGAIATVLIVLIMIAFTLFLNQRISAIQDKIIVKERELSALKVKLKEVENYEKNNEEVRKKAEIIEQLKKKQVIPLRILDEASRQLPKGVWLTEITDKTGLISIQGYAFSNSDLVTYIQNLKQSKHFIDVMLVESRQADIEEYSVYKFKLTFRIKV